MAYNKLFQPNGILRLFIINTLLITVRKYLDNHISAISSFSSLYLTLIIKEGVRASFLLECAFYENLLEKFPKLDIPQGRPVPKTSQKSQDLKVNTGYSIIDLNQSSIALLFICTLP